MRYRNPVFGRYANRAVSENRATMAGITTKTIILTAVTIVSGIISVLLGMRVTVVGETPTVEMTNALWIAFGLSGIFALIASFVGMFVPKTASVMSFVYAITQGISLGVLSAVMELYAPGIVLIAVGSTVAIFFIMLLLYKNNTFRNRAFTFKFMTSLLLGALVASLIVSLTVFVMGANAVSPGVYFLIALAFLVYSALMFVFDFDYANAVVESGLDKKYEWVASFSLLITIIMIYIRILRLLSIFFQRNE